MQLTYKQAVEIAEEQAIIYFNEGNKYELTKKDFTTILTVLGIGAVKNSLTTSEGVNIDYVDPARFSLFYTRIPTLTIYIMLVK